MTLSMWVPAHVQLKFRRREKHKTLEPLRGESTEWGDRAGVRQPRLLDHIWPNTYVCMAREPTTVFTLFNGWGKKTLQKYYDMWKLSESQKPVSINKMLIGHRLIHRCVVWVLSLYKGLQNLKHSLSGLLKKKFADPCDSDNLGLVGRAGTEWWRGAGVTVATSNLVPLEGLFETRISEKRPKRQEVVN